MKYRHTFRVRVRLVDAAWFHVSAASLKAITLPLIPVQLHHAPEQMGDDEMGSRGLGRAVGGAVVPG
ncbi:hypothetical protein ACFLTC_02535 [Chloroflexota bacterium]